ncbi:MAG: Smr/MutS family protein [Bacteroidia bacterium]|nr:Smr/MutS family protein [Bacteroidia bacterium]
MYKTITGYKEKFLFFKLYDPAKPNELPLVEDNSTILEARPSVEKKKSNNDVLEVDLHIEELTDKYTTMTPTEMLTLQQSICRQKIEFAIAKQYKKIVFIHGVGNGVLKQEVRKLLNNYIDLKYRDASPLKYGQGATEVLLDY